MGFTIPGTVPDLLGTEFGVEQPVLGLFFPLKLTILTELKEVKMKSRFTGGNPEWGSLELPGCYLS